MNKEKTVLQMLIHELLIYQNNAPYKSIMYSVIDEIIPLAEELLQKEQEQIEKAFEDGIYSGKVFNKPIQGKNYYKSKYGGER